MVGRNKCRRFVKQFTSEYCFPSYVLVQTLPREVSMAKTGKSGEGWLGLAGNSEKFSSSRVSCCPPLQAQ